MPTSSAASDAGVPVDSAPVVSVSRFRVEGMHCAGCVQGVRGAIEAVSGVATVDVDLQAGEAVVRGRGFDPADVLEAIVGRGFAASEVPAQRSAGDRRSAIEQAQLERERNWARRAASGLLFWVPIPVLHWLVDAPWTVWAMAALATLSVMFVGSGFYGSAGRALRHGRTNMDTLISLGATTAWIYSSIRLVGHATGHLPAAEALYFGETAGLFALVSVGHWLEARASARAGASIRELLELQPDVASILNPEGREELVPTETILPGDRIRIRPGERIPIDGVVVGGLSEVDASAVTGESIPTTAGPGDQIAAGCLNGTGTLVVRASRDGSDTTVARIAGMVADAQSSKAGLQRLADRVSAVFVPCVVLIATGTFFGWWLLGGDLGAAVVNAVTVLVISCPCALGIAIPMAVMVATGAASRHGILLRSAAALEGAGAATGIIFDKTGTLTHGRLTVTSIEPFEPGLDERSVLMAAAAVEALSEHPVARAISARAADDGIPLRPVTEFRALPGEGAMATVDGIPVRVVRDPTGRGACVVEARGRAIGRISVADAPRAETPAVIARLRELGLRPAMLTGDREQEAQAMGARLGLRPEEITAEASPEEKHAAIANAPGVTIMVGDGINDAAALAEADLGVAIGSGTNVAIESAAVVLSADSIRGVPAVVGIARASQRIIRQNLFLAFVYNAAAIPVAAAGLLGPHGPLYAAVAMALSDLCVVGNALRLRPTIDRIALAAAELGTIPPPDAPIDDADDDDPTVDMTAGTHGR
ncbi:MAG: heavy metal translocating P-type ATPase [Phycisphaerales bacterium]